MRIVLEIKGAEVVIRVEDSPSTAEGSPSSAENSATQLQPQSASATQQTTIKTEDAGAAPMALGRFDGNSASSRRQAAARESPAGAASSPVAVAGDQDAGYAPTTSAAQTYMNAGMAAPAGPAAFVGESDAINQVSQEDR
jgi:hypothetical protein